jgi:hypothetical protein
MIFRIRRIFPPTVVSDYRVKGVLGPAASE